MCAMRRGGNVTETNARGELLHNNRIGVHACMDADMDTDTVTVMETKFASRTDPNVVQNHCSNAVRAACGT